MTEHLKFSIANRQYSIFIRWLIQTVFMASRNLLLAGVGNFHVSPIMAVAVYSPHLPKPAARQEQIKVMAYPATAMFFKNDVVFDRAVKPISTRWQIKKICQVEIHG